MNVRRFSNHIIDLDQVVSKERQDKRIILTFRNGDQLEVAWRDELERQQMLSELGDDALAVPA